MCDNGRMDDITPRLDDTDLDDLIAEPIAATPVDVSDDVFAMLTAKLNAAENQLAAKRAERKALNDEIRQLVADVGLLTRARNVFVKPPRKRKP